MYKKYVKRIIDIVVSLVLCILTAPISLIISILIRIDSKGPVIFKQERIGYKGKPFNLYKYRTMKVDTHKDGKELTHDERCTKLGKVLRKLSLDELPQLINVLKGEMSLIGPRPWIPEYYKYFSTEQKKRCDVIPGMTGLAQAMGRNNLDIFQKIKYDVEYTKNVSFKMDCKVVIETIKTLLSKTGTEIKQEEIKDEINMLKAQ